MVKNSAAAGVSWVGHVLIPVLRVLYRLGAFFFGNKWKHPLPDFEENPRTMSPRQVIYLGYKYYCQPHTAGQPDFDAPAYFSSKTIDMTPPAAFVAEHTCSLHAGGDLMPYKLVNPDSAAALWDEVGADFFGADIVTANLETPIHPGRKPAAVPEMMLYHLYFNGSEQMFEIFNGNGKHKGYDVLSVANNHSLDMGEAGLAKTLSFLQAKAIAHCGAALSEDHLHHFPILERNGIKTAFLSYTYSLNNETTPAGKPWLVNHLPLNVPGCDLAMPALQCRLARSRGADVVVVSLHCGNAYQAYPSGHTVALFHRFFAECGPDVILGGHPHNIQPMETIPFTDPLTGQAKKGFAIYSLGDFVAYDIFTWGHLPVFLRLQCSKGMLADKPYSCVTRAEAVPLYMCHFRATRQLKFLYLEAALGRQHTLPEANVRELEQLHRFYRAHFASAGSVTQAASAVS